MKNLKKVLTIILALSVVASMTACGNKKTTADDKKENDIKIEEKIDKEENKKDEKEDKKDASDKNEEEKKTDKTDKTENKKDTVKKDETKKDDKNVVVSKPSETDKTEQKKDNNTVTMPAEKPSVSNPEKNDTKKDDIIISKPETKPTTPEKPEEKPNQSETSATVGNTLLSEFKSKASSESDVLKIANALVTNPIIEFAGDAVEVEPGLLTGFRNNKITGFKKGAMFGPIIGSIPFIGYVFELEDGTNASEFIAHLRSSANLRWNICTEAEEMITGSVGNKVFFVMCRKTFDEEF